MLGVFPASFDLSAVGAIWGLEEDAATKLLGLLRRYSLIDYDETSSRYGLHDLLADYALSQMENEEEQGARLQHASHYKDVLITANNIYLVGGDQVLIGLRLFDLEWENIRIGQAWVSQDTDDKDYLELCNKYSNAGYMIVSLRLHPREYITWLGMGLDAAKKLKNKEYEAYHLGNLGSAYRELGDARKAIEFYEQALVIDREIGDRRGEGADLGNLGLAHADLGDARKAIEFYEGQLVIVREIGDRRGEGNSLGNLGSAYGDLGDAHRAIEFHEQALVIDREIGDRRGEGADLFNMGLALYDLEEKNRAVDLVKGALEIYEGIESPNAEKARNKLKEWGALQKDEE